MTYTSIWQDLHNTPLTQAWAVVGGVHTRFWRSGETGSDVLFLHGTGGHVEAFARNIGEFGTHHRAWAMDLLGHGWSDLSRVDLEIADYTRHVLNFLDTMGIDRVVLVGISLGGWVATQFAIDHPERVAALILATPGGSQADRAVMRTIRTATSAAVEELNWDTVRSRLEYLVHDPSAITDDLVATRMSIYSRPGMTQNMAHVLVLQDPDTRARNLIDAHGYGQITCPVLVVWTEHDPTATVIEGRRVASMISGAEFLVLDDCAHWPQFEKADLFNRLGIDFIARSSTSTAPEVAGHLS